MNDLKNKYNIVEAYFDINKGLFLFAKEFNGSFIIKVKKKDLFKYNFNEIDTDLISADSKIISIVVI